MLLVYAFRAFARRCKSSFFHKPPHLLSLPIVAARAVLPLLLLLRRRAVAGACALVASSFSWISRDKLLAAWGNTAHSVIDRTSSETAALTAILWCWITKIAWQHINILLQTKQKRFQWKRKTKTNKTTVNCSRAGRPTNSVGQIEVQTRTCPTRARTHTHISSLRSIW